MSGASAATITPPVGYPIQPDGRQATGIDDDLMTRCLVLQREDSVAVLITLDLLEVTSAVTEAIVERTANATGLPADVVFVAATGNATSPVIAIGQADIGLVTRYSDYLPDIVAGNVLSALSNIEPAAADTTSALIPNISCIEDPDASSTAFPTLDRAKVLYVQAADSRVIGCVVETDIQAIVRAGCKRWTADFPGALCWQLQQLGVEAPIYMKGDIDGIAPFDWYRGNTNPSHAEHTADDANQLGLILATQVSMAYHQSFSPRRNVDPCDLISQFAVAPSGN